MTESVITATLGVAPVLLAGLVFIFLLKGGYFASIVRPIDSGLTVKGKRLFGDNKTWLGFVVMGFGTSIFSLTIFVFLSTSDIMIPFALYYSPFHAILLGLMYGAIYSLSELPNSFLKRQQDISPGGTGTGVKGRIFNVIDICDSVFGCTIFALLALEATHIVAIFTFLIGCGVHAGTDLLMRLLGLKSS